MLRPCPLYATLGLKQHYFVGPSETVISPKKILGEITVLHVLLLKSLSTLKDRGSWLYLKFWELISHLVVEFLHNLEILFHGISGMKAAKAYAAFPGPIKVPAED